MSNDYFDQEVRSDAVLGLQLTADGFVVRVLKDRYPETPIKQRFVEAAWEDDGQPPIRLVDPQR